MAESLDKNFIDSAEYPQTTVIEAKCGEFVVDATFMSTLAFFGGKSTASIATAIVTVFRFLEFWALICFVTQYFADDSKIFGM